jgi:hypothetical protein
VHPRRVSRFKPALAKSGAAFSVYRMILEAILSLTKARAKQKAKEDA